MGMNNYRSRRVVISVSLTESSHSLMMVVLPDCLCLRGRGREPVEVS